MRSIDADYILSVLARKNIMPEGVNVLLHRWPYPVFQITGPFGSKFVCAVELEVASDPASLFREAIEFVTTKPSDIEIGVND